MKKFDDIFYTIEFGENDDPLQIQDLLRMNGSTASIAQVWKNIFVKEYLKEEYFKNGISKIVASGLLEEAVLPKTTNVELLFKVMKALLSNLNPQNELIIIDNYVFPNNCDTDYINNFALLFQGLPNTFKSLIIITKPSYNQTLFNDFKTQFPNSQFQINIKTSSEFHDRFWIVDESKGLFVGTSLNGIGKKYSLADYLDKDDIKIIVDELKTLNLL